MTSEFQPCADKKFSLVQVWLVGAGLSEEEQMTAPKGTIFIPLSPFPPKKMRRDCFYNSTPAMLAPKHLENVDSCEVRHIPIFLSISFYNKIPKFNSFHIFLRSVSMKNRIGCQEE